MQNLIEEDLKDRDKFYPGTETRCWQGRVGKIEPLGLIRTAF